MKAIEYMYIRINKIVVTITKSYITFEVNTEINKIEMGNKSSFLAKHVCKQQNAGDHGAGRENVPKEDGKKNI